MLATLVALLGTWAAKGRPNYGWEADDERLPYLSDIAATSWGYPLFIAGSAVSIVTFTSAFVGERWLRHKGRLAHNYNRTEKILSIFATLFAIIGSAGLILLTIFDTRRHNRVHHSMLAVFIIGFLISAIFLCEYPFPEGLAITRWPTRTMLTTASRRRVPAIRDTLPRVPRAADQFLDQAGVHLHRDRACDRVRRDGEPKAVDDRSRSGIHRLVHLHHLPVEYVAHPIRFLSFQHYPNKSPRETNQSQIY